MNFFSLSHSLAHSRLSHIIYYLKSLFISWPFTTDWLTLLWSLILGYFFRLPAIYHFLWQTQTHMGCFTSIKLNFTDEHLLISIINSCKSQQIFLAINFTFISILYLKGKDEGGLTGGIGTSQPSSHMCCNPQHLLPLNSEVAEEI